MPARGRKGNKDMIRLAFTGPGRGLSSVLRDRLPKPVIRAWMSRAELRPQTLPRELKCEHWVALHDLPRRPLASERLRRSAQRKPYGKATATR